MNPIPALQRAREALLSWAAPAIERGWLNPECQQRLEAIDLATPAALFNQTLDEKKRPLVVALFGGTGAGKSTLLNRFAGEDIAQASVIRPTSREVTVYVHRDVAMQDLARLLPLQQVGVAYHDNPAWQHVLWIDTPDIDSIELANHQRLRQWLSYIDVLLYVVSPERYRDDKGWQVLQAELQAHAWMFVMNHWDQGHPLQRDDFHSQLQGLGFEQPAIYCTDCQHQPATDDFQALSEQVAQLSEAKVAAFLEWRSQSRLWQRLEEEKARLRAALQGGGEDVLPVWQARWQGTLQEVEQSCAASFSLYAKHFSVRRQGWKAWLLGPGELTQAPADVIRQHGLPELSGLDLRVDAALDHLVLLAAQDQQPTEPLADALAEVRSQWLEQREGTLKNALLAAMSTPKNSHRARVQAFLQQAALWLPLALVAWAGYRLLQVYLAPVAQGGYLNLDFAIHSAMLVGLGWLLPQVSANLLATDWQQQAKRGLNQGVEQLMGQLAEPVEACYRQDIAEREALLAQLPAVEQNAAQEEAADQATRAALARFTVSEPVR